MLDDFIAYIRKENLFLPEERAILAVSGGMDSVVMAHLFQQAGFTFGIVHVNFMLRGEESQRDEDFVRELALGYNVPFFSERFQTKEFARKNKLSVQMAARQLRYEWFDRLLDEKGYDCAAVAHHLDDQVETFLINLARGTGIAGLHGIKPRQGRIIRPLMFVGRNLIERYALEQGLKYVEDSSNLSLKYSRNRIRHRVIPQLEKINPSFRNDISRTINHIRDAEMIYRKAVVQQQERLLLPWDNGFKIPVGELKKLSPGITWLYELISGFDFSATDASRIWESLGSIPGKTFYSQTHRLVKDRDYLLIDPLVKDPTDGSKSEIYIHELPYEMLLEYPLRIHFIKIDREDFEMTTDANIASLDLDKIKLPLIIRRWKKGDYFNPLGFSGSKKISDFFTDLKFSIPQKDNTWLLCCDEDITWVIGHRIDDRFKITSATRRILRVTYMEATDSNV